MADTLHNQYDSQGRKQGYWEETNERGYICKGHYKNNQRQGLWKTYYEDDRGTLVAECHYVDGLREGLWKEYYSDGTIYSKGTYLNNKKHGLWKWYRSDDTLETEGHYLNGKLHGLWKEYHRDGTLESCTLYNMDNDISSSLLLLLGFLDLL